MPSQAQHLMRHFRLDGAGTEHQNGAYSQGAPGRYWVGGFSEQAFIDSVVISVQDTGNFSAENYGAFASPLANGILFHKEDAEGNIILDLCDGSPVKSSADWAGKCHELTPLTFGSGDNFVTVRWLFKNYGIPLILEPGWKLVLVIRDDLSGLVNQEAYARGMFPDRLSRTDRFNLESRS